MCVQNRVKYDCGHVLGIAITKCPDAHARDVEHCDNLIQEAPLDGDGPCHNCMEPVDNDDDLQRALVESRQSHAAWSKEHTIPTSAEEEEAQLRAVMENSTVGMNIWQDVPQDDLNKAIGLSINDLAAREAAEDDNGCTAAAPMANWVQRGSAGEGPSGPRRPRVPPGAPDDDADARDRSNVPAEHPLPLDRASANRPHGHPDLAVHGGVGRPGPGARGRGGIARGRGRGRGRGGPLAMLPKPAGNGPALPPAPGIGPNGEKLKMRRNRFVGCGHVVDGGMSKLPVTDADDPGFFEVPQQGNCPACGPGNAKGKCPVQDDDDSDEDDAPRHSDGDEPPKDADEMRRRRLARLEAMAERGYGD
ncbi:hypothetical protein EJ06DRAFT_573857 [Trichodelitschia bisporula]|uniref:Uncharacterized protein n=1 Tax=Trichodelitschia bisporula TaxID=703511 RepID=A0A6G1I1N4_9PEZI|nr:hypothetical protein EJ06DRAFT_573857 [Trichodelitschia bisporula]